jgi:ABC-type multidrug transport system fused ATPase/permease subunit
MSQPPRSKKEIFQIYRQNIEIHETVIGKLKQSKRILAIARLAVVIAGITICWFSWPVYTIFFIALVLFAALFIFLVFRDADKTAAINNRERLISINKHELDAMQQNLHAYDDGHIFGDPAHAYAADLDLFGPASLFQWLSRCHADQSKKLLADFLKSPLPVSIIKEKQSAVKELSEKQEACQQFQSMALANPLSIQTEKRLESWIALPAGGFEKPVWKWIRILYPVIALVILGLFMFEYISTGIFLSCLIGFFIISSAVSSKIQRVYELLSLIQPEMNSLYQQLHLVEKESFESTFLHDLQTSLKPEGYPSASASMGDFHRILKRFDIRLNILVFVFLNAFLLWDLRQMLALNDWKKKNQNYLPGWFHIIADMEVCISMASLLHNEPEWCFPEVDEKYFHYQAEEIGHPLIPADTRITNNFTMKGTGKIALITGSNMAGKSTFLRSLGINTVLALAGAPVCARRMNLSELKLVSSMRVADNLAENTSTFYAELKKLQYIIESVNRKERVLILLDEVLRGTNSTDRHKGSQALVRQLIQNGAVAVMATHDTGLAHSESNAFDSVSNYHFEGKIINDELLFDYKIKKGICESLNATTLMKKIGIHFQD